MYINKVNYPDTHPISGYGPNFFRIGPTLHEGPCLVGYWGFSAWKGLEDTTPLIALKDRVDVLLLGVGKDVFYPPKELKSLMIQHNIGLEVMTTPSACRTYNVLLAEGRRVGAALLPLQYHQGI